MKVFISWSGSRSRAAARALRDWIPCVFQNVEPWMSEDILAGSMWLSEIMNGLKEARFGIVCKHQKIKWRKLSQGVKFTSH